MTGGRRRSRAGGDRPGGLRVAAVVVQLGVVASYNSLHAQCPDGSPPPCRSPTRPTAPAPNSVAVLYFDNLSRDSADAYLAEGLTEELIAQLGRVERLVVKSRNAVRRYRGADLDPAQLGRALGIANLVSGSVRRSGNRLRVTVELVRATTGVRLWGEQYDRAQADLLDLQEGIARAVAGVIAGRLLPAERASLAARPTRSAEAYDYFVKGNYYLAQRTARSTNRAVDQYSAALRLDPGFTRALARIAYAHAQTLYWGSFAEDVPADSVLARGLAAADGALHQDSTSSDAWMARAFLLSYRDPRVPEQARDAIKRAVALDPRNAEAHHQYGTFLTTTANTPPRSASISKP
jgi:TolB-like protein